MGIDVFIENLIEKYHFLNRFKYESTITEFAKVLYKLEHKNIYSIALFGSSLKETKIEKEETVSLLLAIKTKDPREINQFMTDLLRKLERTHIHAYKKGIKLMVPFKGLEIELTIGKHKKGTYHYFYLYNDSAKKVIVTNPNLHHEEVRKSGLQHEIMLIKLWRNKHQLHFPSMYLEMVVINVLRKNQKKNLLGRVLLVLSYLQKEFIFDTYYDPSNTNNKLSDSITLDEKMAIQKAARNSISQKFLNEILV